MMSFSYRAKLSKKLNKCTYRPIWSEFCADPFYNKTGTRLKILIHDGLGIWLCTRTLDNSKFHGLGERLMRHHSPSDSTTGLTISHEQFNTLISGLPWHNLGKDILTPLT